MGNHKVSSTIKFQNFSSGILSQLFKTLIQFRLYIIKSFQTFGNFVIYQSLFSFRKNAELQMEGQFLVRQIYDDELTYNLISAAVEVLSEFPKVY